MRRRPCCFGCSRARPERSNTACIALIFALSLGNALSLGIGLPARAESPGATLERAVFLYSKGEFDGSRALLERVLTLADGAGGLSAELRARAHLYLGLNEAAAGRLSATRRHFIAALRLDPAIQINRDHLKTAVVEILDELRLELRGTLVVETNVPLATVVVDGQVAGTSPYRGQHGPGRHRIVVRPPAGGRTAYLAHRADVVLAAGATTRLSVQLLQLDASRQRERATSGEGRGALRRWAWITAAGALATGGAAVGLGVVALGRRDEADAFARTGDPASSDDRQRHLELVDRSEQMETGCNIAWTVAGALVLTSAVLFTWDLLRRRRPSPSM